jgi:hypothetical protein
LKNPLGNENFDIVAHQCIRHVALRICGRAVATIKSRVNRARSRPTDLLAIDSVDDFGPERATRAVLAGGGLIAQCIST